MRISDWSSDVCSSDLGEIYVHVVFEIDCDIGQSEQADRANLLHLRQTGQRRLHRRGEEQFDVLGSQARRLGIDVELDRGDIRARIDRHVAQRIEAETERKSTRLNSSN